MKDARPRIQAIGYETLFDLLQDENILNVSIKNYQFDLIKLYDLAKTNFSPIVYLPSSHPAPRNKNIFDRIINKIKTLYHQENIPLALWYRCRFVFLRPLKKYIFLPRRIIKYYYRYYYNIKSGESPDVPHPVILACITKKYHLLEKGELAKIQLDIKFILLKIFSRKTYINIFSIKDITEKTSKNISMGYIEPERDFLFEEANYFPLKTPTTTRKLNIPSKWIATINNAMIIRGFQIIHDKSLITYENAANFNLGFISGLFQTMYGFSYKNKTCEKILVINPYQNKKYLDEGILISGRCSPNYFHWLIEYLPKIYLLSKHQYYDRIPLIIDSRMTSQQFASLKLVVGDWPIYSYDGIENILDVKKLHVPSISTFHPDNFLKIPFWQGSVICHESLHFIKNKILKNLNFKEDTVQTRKIYLARKNLRNLINALEIESLLKNLGFEIIFPELLSFEQQVNLFRSAAVIVGPLGAAFANVIFCEPGAKILGFITPFARGYSIQSNLAKFAGCEYYLLEGEHPKFEEDYWQKNPDDSISSLFAIHESFSINLKLLNKALVDLNMIDPGISVAI